MKEPIMAWVINKSIGTGKIEIVLTLILMFLEQLKGGIDENANGNKHTRI